VNFKSINSAVQNQITINDINDQLICSTTTNNVINLNINNQTFGLKKSIFNNLTQNAYSSSSDEMIST